jgi:hypothetical protein
MAASVIDRAALLILISNEKLALQGKGDDVHESRTIM